MAENIRNISVIAHVDHGKTTLSDSLLAKAGVISSAHAGNKCAMDTRIDEKEKGITIKSTAISLLFPFDRDVYQLTKELDTPNECIVNLIDSPGHVDFSSEVTAALRVTDGALVVVDCVEGVNVQTQTVIRQALSEKVKPVLFINKLDRCIFETQLSCEDLYQSLRSIITEVNGIISTFSDEQAWLVDPSLGNVSFGSGLQGWGFNLRQFARMHAERSGVKEEKLMKKLWGDHFFNIESKKWSKVPTEEDERAFNLFVLEPVYEILKLSRDVKKEELYKKLPKLKVDITQEDRETEDGKLLLKRVMTKWLPVADSILDIVVRHLPSPLTAQRYRTAYLYEGPQDDEVAIGMKTCDAEGPLMIYVSKMVPSANKGRFIAFGRVFSGRVRGGETVRIMGPGYDPGNKSSSDLHKKSLSRPLIMMGAKVMPIDGIPAGNIVGLSGLDKLLVKTGTITTYPDAHNIKVLKFSICPVVRVAVDPVNPADMPKLVEGLQRLSNSDLLVQCSVDNGQHIVCGAGELHLEICLKDLETEYSGIPLKKSKPVVSYRETVGQKSDRICLAKSNNKLCRLFMTAEPLHPDLSDAIEQEVLSTISDPKEKVAYLTQEFDFDRNEAKKIWCFGPNGSGPNMLVDCTKAAQYLQEARDTIQSGFQWVTQEGVLCEENMRGVRFNIMDVQLHSDPAHRRGAQIIPAMRRALFASYLTAEPKMFEPIYKVHVLGPTTVIGAVHSIVAKRRGDIVEELHHPTLPTVDVTAFLPVNESFGFTEELRSLTSGKAFPQCVFDHWQLFPGNPLDQSTQAHALVVNRRKEKGLNPAIPTLENFLDKL